jgi:pimeloyl-ACP methyl ester carboxylesterase
MSTFLYNNKKIAFEKKGEGPAMVFLHGFCEDQSMWHSLGALADDWGITFISIDLPGFGQSDTITSCSIEEMADIVHTFCQTQQHDRIALMGHSMGGYVALAFAEKYPQLLSGLGIIHSHPYEDSEAKKEARQKSIAFIEKKGSASYVRQLIPKLFPPEYAVSYPQIVQPLVEKALAYDPRGIMNALAAMKNRPDRTEVLASLEVPVLFIVGALDELESSEKLIGQTHLPHVASIHILEQVGHMGIFEAPDRINQVVSDFATFIFHKP